MKKFIASMIVLMNLLLAGDAKMTDMSNEQAYNDAFHSMSTFIGADQTTSVKLRDGRVVWLFNDTFNHKDKMLHNSIVIQNKSKFEHLSPIKEIIPNNSDGSFYWPFSGVQIGNMLFVSCARVKLIGSGLFDFKVLGVDMIRMIIEYDGVRFIDKLKTPASNAGEFGILWGASMIKHNGYIYMYGSQKVIGSFGKPAYVARFDYRNAKNPMMDWEYWDGSQWNTDQSKAKAIIPSIHGISTTFSVFHHNGKFKILTKKYDAFGSDVVILSSTKPFGPFAEKTVMKSISTSEHYTYNPMAHDWAAVGDNNLLISINHNGSKTEYMPTFHVVSKG